MKRLGKLARVDLREVWPNEAGDFTPWLAREENLESLGDALGMEIELEATEKKAGPYSTDILCKSEDGNIVIENQLETTNHDHLGKLLTYAAHFNAHTLVWVAKEFTDQHRAAIDWLNENSTQGTRYFGLEIEVWRIGESEPAPKFNIVARPNDWTRARKALTKDQQLRVEFWTGFRAHLAANATRVESTSDAKGGGPVPWMRPCHVAVPGFNLVAATFVKKKEIRATLRIRKGAKTDGYFSQLEAQRDRIEQEIGRELIWEKPTIYLRQDGDLYDEDAWSQQYAWLLDGLEDLHRGFESPVRDLPT